MRPSVHQEISEKRGRHRVEIQYDSGAIEETCGKLKFICNGVLTYTERMLILVSSLEATLQDREATLFDNQIDLPESVRPHSGFRARMGF
jgi:hypothetical protein